MDLRTAKQVFAELMQVARKRVLTAREKSHLTNARQQLRKAAKPAMNAHKAPKRVAKKATASNPAPKGAIKIYGRCLRIEAQKLVAHTYGGKPARAGQKYFHDFSSKNAMIYGLPDGSLLIKAK